VFLQTFEGVGLTKQKAKIAAAERALRHGFVQFRDVEPVIRVLQARDRRDVIDPRDDVIDFSADEPLPASRPRTSVETIFAGSSSSAPASAAAADDVVGVTVTTSCG